jgi:hypothetical protein
MLSRASTLIAQETRPHSAVPPDGFQFSGSWDCEGAFRNGTVHKARFTGDTILAGTWIELTEHDVQPTTGYVAKYLIGYDAAQHRLVEFDANNFGAATYTSADGWVNHALTMTSAVSADAHAPYVANRFVYTIVAPTTFSVDWQTAKTAALDWVQSDHLVCQRRSNS